MLEYGVSTTHPLPRQSVVVALQTLPPVARSLQAVVDNAETRVAIEKAWRILSASSRIRQSGTKMSDKELNLEMRAFNFLRKHGEM